MHEMSIASSVVEICAEQANGARVMRVTLEIGQLSAVMPDIETPGQARCLACGASLTLAEPFGQCECGSVDLELISGQQLKIRQMELM